MMVKWKTGSNLNQTDTVLFTLETIQAVLVSMFALLHEHTGLVQFCRICMFIYCLIFQVLPVTLLSTAFVQF